MFEAVAQWEGSGFNFQDWGKKRFCGSCNELYVYICVYMYIYMRPVTLKSFNPLTLKCTNNLEASL